MNAISFTVYPKGLSRCLTMSYDDGREEDVRLIEIFDKYHIKGTFHVNSALAYKDKRIDLSAMKEVYKNHELSCHMATHPFPTKQPDAVVLQETVTDRLELEKVCGYVVRGMSYPYGNYNSRVIDIIRSAGIEYARTVKATKGFQRPDDFLEWHPTCHHGDAAALLPSFLEASPQSGPLFYVWGHSYEFDRDNNWDQIEEFCEKVSDRDDMWYATNIEIVDYVNAQKALRFSYDCSLVYNPSAIPVWILVNKEPVEIPAGTTVAL